MKIAIVTHSLSGGGAERVATVLAHGLAKRSHNVSIFFERSTAGDYDPRSSVKLARLDGRTRLARLSSLVKYLCAGDYDIVHTVTPLLTVEALIALKYAGQSKTKVIGAYHRYGKLSISYGLLSNLSYLLTPIITRVAAKNICVSEGLRRSLVNNWGAKNDNLVTIYNPVHIPVGPTPVPANRSDMGGKVAADYILYVGRLSKEKNPALAIEALAALPDTLSSLNLLVLGEGPLQGELEKIARDLKVDHRVIFKKYVVDPWDYYRNAILLISTSDRESFSLVIVEAMGLGIPVVATSSGGPQEILENGRFGELVPIGDKASLAAAIVRTIDKPPFKEMLRERAAQFNVRRALNAYEDLFKSVAGLH
jgi:glycosyltransferase involved in cell wall biosynthesis